MPDYWASDTWKANQALARERSMATDHATQVRPIQTRAFDIKSNETGERVRVIVEQLDEGTHQSMTRYDLWDEACEFVIDEFAGGRETLDLLEVQHPYPYEGGR